MESSSIHHHQSWELSNILVFFKKKVDLFFSFGTNDQKKSPVLVQSNKIWWKAEMVFRWLKKNLILLDFEKFCVAGHKCSFLSWWTVFQNFQSDWTDRLINYRLNASKCIRTKLSYLFSILLRRAVQLTLFPPPLRVVWLCFFLDSSCQKKKLGPSKNKANFLGNLNNSQRFLFLLSELIILMENFHGWNLFVE